MAPRRTDDGSPSWDGRDGEVVTMRDGSKWVWGTTGGVLGVGSTTGWTKLDATVADTPSAPVVGVPSDQPTSPQAGATDPGGAGAPAAVTPADQPPTGVDDNRLAAWLNEHAMAMDKTIADLQTAYDTAQAALVTAQASGDPEALRAATAAITSAGRAVQNAQQQQARYLAQLQPVQARLDKADARNDPQAQEERKQRLAALQAQIDANAAAQALSKAQLAKAIDPTSVAADNALKSAQTAADNAGAAASKANADWTNARIQAGEPAVDVAGKVQDTEESKARTAQIQALIDAGMPAAQAALVVAQGTATDIAGQVSAEDLHQKQLGELGTLQEQLQKQVDAGTLKASDARDILQAAVDKLRTGATPYERQQQTAANSLAVARDAMQQGTLVNMGQPYATGAEPGGAYSQMSENLGYGPYSQPLNPTPLPRALASLGGDVNAPYTAGQLGLPAQGTPGGGPTSADSFTFSPAVQNGPGNVPPAVASVGQAAIDWSALTFQQAKALLRGQGGAVTPQVPPQATVPVVGHGAGRAPGPAGV